MRIELRCACGATFSAESRNSEWLGTYNVQDAAKAWQERHDLCRLVAARGMWMEQQPTPTAPGGEGGR